MDVLRISAKGHRTLVEALDAWADRYPAKIHAHVLRGMKVSDGYRSITHREIRDAADAFAWWLLETYGRPEKSTSIAYVGLNDLRYAIVFYGAIKAGFTSLFVSPRNPPSQNASLLEQTSCRLFVHSPEMASIVTAVVELISEKVQTAEIPILEHWLEQRSRPFPFRKTLDEAKWDPVVVLHSSGSTGIPKPITLNNGYFAAFDFPLPSVPGRAVGGSLIFDFPQGGSYFSQFPPYHLAGLQSMCYLPVMSFEASVIMSLPDRPPSPQLMCEIIVSMGPKAFYSPPSLIEAIAQLPDGLKVLSSCEFIIYAGGPLSKACGNVLAEKVKLSTVYGSTETGSNPVLLPHQPMDWDFLEFHPNFYHRMELSVDGAYELIFSQEDPMKETRCISWSYPLVREYRTRDMFVQHPSRSDLWKFYGRNDDIIVFSNGSKYNPIPAEDLILGNSKLSGVLIVGDGREQAALLLEPREPPITSAALIAEIVPDVERANAQNQKQGRILHSKIAVVDSGGFVRSPKGTVVRKSTCKKFETLIEELYDDDRPISDQEVTIPKLQISDNIRVSLTTFVRDCIRVSTTAEDIDENQDLYVHGLDSVQTIGLCRALRIGLSSHYGNCSWLGARYIFDHPSINTLVQALQEKVLSFQDSGAHTSFKEAKCVPVQRLNSMILRHVQSVDLSAGKATEIFKSSKRGMNITLTGTTGSLGVRLLWTFANDPSISKINCLDRSSDAGNRVKQSYPKLPFEKIHFFQVRLGEKNFGLNPQLYQQLTNTTDVMIHNAWKVDFNQNIESFEPVHLNSLDEMVEFSSQCAVTPHLFFVSSMSAMANWTSVHGSSGPIPEAISDNPDVAAISGYAQSKFVGENILAHLCAKSQGRIPVTILRMGQIAGPVLPPISTPVWNPSEWIPAMLLTSKELRYVPSWIPDLDWIPVDILAEIVREVLGHETKRDHPEKQHAEIYNIVNPRSTKWSTLIQVVQSRLSGSGTCSVVTLREWIEKLKELDISDEDNLRRFPAIKILDFYDTLAKTHESVISTKVEVRKGMDVSNTMANLKAVDSAWLVSWMDQWQL